MSLDVMSYNAILDHYWAAVKSRLLIRALSILREPQPDVNALYSLSTWPPSFTA